MKKSIFILLSAGCSILLSGCYSETTHPKTTVSDCNPNMQEMIGARVPHRMPANGSDAVNPSEWTPEEWMSVYSWRHILSVSCTGDKEMQLIHYDPDFVCCLTPHSSCKRDGNTITLNDWDTGVEPCHCMCPRKVETSMTGIPYGEYTFILQRDGKEVHRTTISFAADTDALIVFE